MAPRKPRVTKARKREIDDMCAVMSTEQGRRFVWRQLGAAGIFHECYNAEAEGGRRVGLALLREIMACCPGLYLAMQKEALDAETLARIEKETKEDSDGLEE